MGLLSATGAGVVNVLKVPWFAAETGAGVARGAVKGVRDGVNGAGALLTQNPIKSVTGFVNYGGHLVDKGFRDSWDGIKQIPHQNISTDLSKFFKYAGSGFQSKDRSKATSEKATEKQQTKDGVHGDSLTIRTIDKTGSSISNVLENLTNATGALSDSLQKGNSTTEVGTNSRGRSTAPTVAKAVTDSKQLQNQNQTTAQNTQQNTASLDL